MCGIVGYIGHKVPLEKILEGLKRLEYRGYDSAGIAYIANGLNIKKTEGKIANLIDRLNTKQDVSLAISHTRWATHGAANETNAHPHKIGKITVVHNGILENYQELKYDLLNEGVKFASDTDTEVISAAINKFYEDTLDMPVALQKFMAIAKGSYALAIIVADEEDKLYIAKKDSPLIVALADDGYFIASDVPAILNFTNKYILLNDLEYGVLSQDSYEIYSIEGKKVTKEEKIFKEKADAIDKNGFEHFMLKEIMEEERVCKETFSYYLNNFEQIPDITKYNKIDIVGCGSTYNVSLVAKHLIEEYLHIPVNVDIASEYRYKNLFIDKKSLVIFISQSGETADTLAAVKKVKELKAKTLGIVNVIESSIAREVDEVIYTKAGIEIAVATTKAYLSQLIVMILIVMKSLVKNNIITEDEFASLKEDINKLPSLINKVLAQKELYEKIAKSIYQNEDMYYIGRGIDYALAEEASLKLKEISYIHCEAYASGELKHGTISLIDKDVPVLGIITDDNLREKSISNLKEVDSRGAKVIVISTKKIDDFKLFIEIPTTNRLFQSLLAVIPIQLIAYEVAKLRKCDIDKPKNLAKSVTVE